MSTRLPYRNISMAYQQYYVEREKNVFLKVYLNALLYIVNPQTFSVDLDT